MTLNEIRVLCAIATDAVYVPEEQWELNTVANLVDHYLIQETAAGYELLPRGRVMIDHLRTIPLPIQTWIIP